MTPSPQNESIPSYQQQIHVLVSSAKWSDLIKYCEDAELETAANDIAGSVPPEIVIPLLLGYLIIDDMSSARHLLHQIPPNSLTPAHPDFPSVIALANHLFSVFTNPTLSLVDFYRLADSHPFSPLHKHLVKALVEATKERMYMLLCKGYETVNEETVASLLGMAEKATKPKVDEKTKKVLMDRGWQLKELSDGKLVWIPCKPGMVDICFAYLTYGPNCPCVFCFASTVTFTKSQSGPTLSVS
ncbi:hypothetical protein BKA69DRAFT_733063 [Paraphysoderma sedebokerense]|nr:hypothetical protein BKA69DRAFT_733063 [Paraphysoderma sedebokerense]